MLQGIDNYIVKVFVLGLNEGWLAIKPTGKDSQPALHVVVVVRVNNSTGQSIVVERYAGTTTGDNWVH